jgi:Helix-turn-helix domain
MSTDHSSPDSAAVRTMGTLQRHPPSTLLILLRHFRKRIDPQIRALGPHLRLPSRCGKPVTQEELAEYIGVSRTWYGLLESKRPVRVSLVLLGRLSVALMLTREERARLFALALPELDFEGDPPHRRIAV